MIVRPMIYFFDDINLHWKNQMIRLIEMQINNIIDIVNDARSMTTYLFV